MENLDLMNKSNAELAELTRSTEDKEVLRAVAEQVGVSYSGNTGVPKLKENILDELVLDENPDKTDEDEDEDEDKLNEDDPIVKALRAKQAAGPVKLDPAEVKKRGVLSLTRAQQAELDPRTKGLTEVEKRAIVRAKALRLHRVRVSNLDPNDSAVPGAIKTAYNKYTGKVSKYIPFGEENEHGYHIPEILINQMREETYNLRKEIKQKGSSFGVKQYKTVQMKKFSFEYLDDLTEQELKSLGQDQKARGALDAQD